jgi:hypothetical protein
MSEATEKPRLWSDFDGTAVEIVPKWNPRNWSKYPLAGIEGYKAFLTAVSDSGVEVAGVISRRPNIAPRRYVTARSISQLGLSRFFGEPSQQVLVGSEENKGDFLARESLKAPVGIIDDKPHRLGSAMLHALFQLQERGGHEDRKGVVLGAVNHPKIESYIDQLAKEALAGGLEVAFTPNGEHDSTMIVGDTYWVKVVPLDPYSAAAGRSFANELLDPIRP